MAEVETPGTRHTPLHDTLWLSLARATRQASDRDLWYAVPFIGATLALTFGPIAARDGWPMNHDLLFWKYRLLVYVEHFRRFELLPIWSESAAQGLGAPLPVLYHKLFYFPATAFYLISGSVKTSVLATLGCFSVAGMLGLRALFCFMGVKPRAALVAGAVFLFCNYTYTNWVVRGAFAEHAAMMLLPWLFRWLAGVLEGETPRRLLRSGAVTFPALYLAHSMLFFFSAIPVLAAVAWRLVRGGDRKPFVAALLGIAGVFAAVSLPIIVCQLAVVPELSFKEGIGVFAPWDHFSSFNQHFTGGQYVWGRDWEGYSVKLDMPLVVIAGVVLVLTLQRKFWPHSKSSGAPARADQGASGWLRSYVAWWLCVPYFAFLLSSASATAYANVPGLWAIQFPWRLLSFVTVLSVILAAYPLLRTVRLGSENGSSAFAWLLLGVTYVSSPWPHPIQYGWVRGAVLEAPLSPVARLHMGAFEYHPKVAGVPGRELIDYLGNLRPAPDALLWSGPSYAVERVDSPAFEKGTRTYRVRTAQPSAVVLPIAYSPFIRIEQVLHGERRRVPTYKQPTDPRIHVDVALGELDLEVRFPTFTSLYADLIARTLHL